jgi:hypothetical protein
MAGEGGKRKVKEEKEREREKAQSICRLSSTGNSAVGQQVTFFIIFVVVS